MDERLREVESLFASMRKAIRAWAFRDGLNREERAVFEDCLHDWCWRFAWRPGSERSLKNLREGLTSFATHHARSFKGIDVEAYRREKAAHKEAAAQFRLKLKKLQQNPASDSSKVDPEDQEKRTS